MLESANKLLNKIFPMMVYGQIKLQNNLEDQFCIYNPLVPGIPKPECGGIRKASLWAKGLYPGNTKCAGMDSAACILTPLRNVLEVHKPSPPKDRPGKRLTQVLEADWGS